MLLSALSALSRRGRCRLAGPGPARRPFRPRLEALEDRLVPATWSVVNPIDGAYDSLRWAVAQAQNGDTIDIWTPTTVLTQGELVLAKDLTIDFKSLPYPYSKATQAVIDGDHL